MAVYSFFSDIFHQSVVVFCYVVFTQMVRFKLRFVLGNASVDDTDVSHFRLHFFIADMQQCDFLY